MVYDVFGTSGLVAMVVDSSVHADPQLAHKIL